MRTIRWIGVAGAIGAACLAAGQVRFEVVNTSKAFQAPFTGRVVVYLAQRAEPRMGPNWFAPEPMLMRRATNLKPGSVFVITPQSAVTFPKRFAEAKNGSYHIQAVIDRNLGGRSIGSSAGNVYSKAVTADIDWAKPQTIRLECDQIVADRTFRNSASVKEVRLPSQLLSRHYKRPFELTAAVVLPEGYEAEPHRRYPILYSVPGFGGNHYALSGRDTRQGTVRDGEKFIYVVLNPDCPTGHSVFADSANNGPWGRALTEELIPFIETHYRAHGVAATRFVTGHSSGGWSSFWLQVAYPKIFGGCWSTSPDPVDFRDFQQIDLYAPKSNVFRDAKGKQRPLARAGQRVLIEYERFCDMERPLRGEQIGSFDGVFSPKGRNGEPAEFFDRMTGAVNSSVIQHWRKYDIGLKLRTQSRTLAPLLKGKLHVYMGNEDTFYLEGATKLVKRDVEAMGNPYEAKIELFPGDHGTVMTPALRSRIDREMAAQYRAWKATQPLGAQL